MTIQKNIDNKVPKQITLKRRKRTNIMHPNCGKECCYALFIFYSFNPPKYPSDR